MVMSWIILYANQKNDPYTVVRARTFLESSYILDSLDSNYKAVDISEERMSCFLFARAGFLSHINEIFN